MGTWDCLWRDDSSTRVSICTYTGLSLEKLIPLIANSWGASKMFERNAPIIVRDELGPSSVPIRNLVKDLEIVIEQARQAGLELAAIVKRTESTARLPIEG